ncbi:MAG: CopG family transcriptional regulator [Thermofilum sp.]
MVSLLLPEQLIDAIDKIARSRGIERSQLIREILENYVRQSGAAPDAPEVKLDPPQPQLDPLTTVELEDFKEALSNFEKKVKEVQLMVEPFLQGRTIGPVGRRTLTSSEMQLMNRVKNLRSEWLRFKRWYKSIGHRDPDLATRLADLYNIIRMMEKGFMGS